MLVVATVAAYRPAIRPTTARAHPVHHRQAWALHPGLPKAPAAPAPLLGRRRRFTERGL